MADGAPKAFLMTDIVGSTRLWEDHGERMAAALVRHDELVESAVTRAGGRVIKSKGEGDSTFSVFPTVAAAVEAAISVNIDLAAEDWPVEPSIRVRAAIHHGVPDERNGDYFGPVINRCARLRAVAHPGQVLLTAAAQTAAPEDGTDTGAAFVDLGLHRLKDIAEPEHVFELSHPALADDHPPLATLDTVPNTLPSFATAFIGRQRERASIAAELSNGTARVLTVCGPVGSGKSRLVVEVGSRCLGRFPDGVWYVNVAGVDEDFFVSEVARTLGVREERGVRLVDLVVDRVRTAACLLVLDGVDAIDLVDGTRSHVNVVGDLVRRLVADTTDLRVLAAGRSPLGIAGEHIVRIVGLTDDTDAAGLFEDRARLVAPDFAVTEANAALVAEVCRQLDSIPLAIELAAARSHVLSPAQILDRLDDRFKLLRSSSRSAGASLHELIGWSYDSLSDFEQRMFRSVAVFAAGFTLEAACAAAGADELDVVDALDHLVNVSLVVSDTTGHHIRFWMLENIRAFASQRLEEAGDVTATRDRVIDHFLDVIDPSTNEDEMRALVSADHDNLRTILRHTIAEGRDVRGAVLAARLAPFWHITGHLNEGRLWLALAEQVAADAHDDAALLATLQGAATLTWAYGELDTARANIERALTLDVADAAKEQELANVLGAIATEQRDFPTATAALERVVQIATERGDTIGRAFALNNLGYGLRLTGDLAGARRRLKEALGVFLEAEHHRALAITRANLGWIAMLRGDAPGAHTEFAAGLSSARRSSPHSEAILLGDLAVSAFELDDRDGAVEYGEQAVALGRRLGEQHVLAQALVALGIARGDNGETATGEALAIAKRLQDVALEAEALVGEARRLVALGMPEAAAVARHALALFVEQHDPLGIAGALDVVAAATAADERVAVLMAGAARMRDGTGAAPLPSVARLLPPVDLVAAPDVTEQAALDVAFDSRDEVRSRSR